MRCKPPAVRLLGGVGGDMDAVCRPSSTFSRTMFDGTDCLRQDMEAAPDAEDYGDLEASLQAAVQRTPPTPASATDSTDGLPQRWCNHLCSATCPYNAPEGGCVFLHVDTFVTQPVRSRQGLPHLMDKNMKGLYREMRRLVLLQAQRFIAARSVLAAWGHDGYLEGITHPHVYVVNAFRRIGWQIPAEPIVPLIGGEKFDLEEAPYTQTLMQILGLVVHTLHYDVAGCPEIMFRTIQYVLSLQRTDARARRGGGESVDSLAYAMDVSSGIVEELLQDESADESTTSSGRGFLTAADLPTLHEPENKRRAKRNKRQRAALRRARTCVESGDSTECS